MNLVKEPQKQRRQQAIDIALQEQGLRPRLKRYIGPDPYIGQSKKDARRAESIMRDVVVRSRKELQSVSRARGSKIASLAVCAQLAAEYGKQVGPLIRRAVLNGSDSVVIENILYGQARKAFHYAGLFRKNAS